MKKTILFIALFVIPFSVSAQSMIETKDTNIPQETETNLLENKVYPQDDQASKEKETTTINIEINLPDIKILPSHPLYLLKKAWEDIRGWFIFNTVKKAEYKINLANQRLEEIEALAQKKKTDLISKTTNEFNEKMDEANKIIEKAKKKKKDLQNVYNLLEANQKKHSAVFSKLLDQVPEEVKEAVNKAKEISENGFEMAKSKINQEEIKEKVKEGLDILENKRY